MDAVRESPGGVLLVEQIGAVRVLTLNRPDARNALDRELIDALADQFDDIDVDDSVRAVVLAAVGDKAFCAGADLREKAGDGEIPYRNFARYQRFKRHGGTKPTVAAVNGAAMAGGFELALACDLMVCSPNARFALAEVKRGMFAGGGGMQLARRIPLAIALEIGLTGEPIDAARAYELGLVNHVVALDGLREEAVRLATAIAANSPLAVTAARSVLRQAPFLTLEELWTASDAAGRSVFGSEDSREGVLAFLEHREPVYRGR